MPAQQRVAPVGGRERTDRVLALGGERHRPAGGVGQLGQGAAHRLEPVDGRPPGQARVQQVEHARGGLLGPLGLAAAAAPAPRRRAVARGQQLVEVVDAGGADLGAATALGRVLGGVRGAHQQLGALGARARRGHAAGHGDGGVALLAQDPQRGGGHGARRVEARPGEHDGELVAGDPRHACPRQRRRRLHERLADAAQGAVAGMVAALVVDALELVDVADQQRQRLAALAPRRQRGRQLLVQRAPVGQPGQLVLVRQPRHAREHLAARDHAAELAGDRLQEAHVATGEARRPGRGGGPDLAPDLALDHDRDADVRLLAEALQQRHGARVGLGVVHGVEVRLRGAQQPVDARMGVQAVGLVVGPALLPGAELADVDQRAHHRQLALPAADRQRRGAHRRARGLRGALEQLVEAARGGSRGRDLHEDLALVRDQPFSGHHDLYRAAIAPA